MIYSCLACVTVFIFSEKEAHLNIWRDYWALIYAGLYESSARRNDRSIQCLRLLNVCFFHRLIKSIML